MKTFKKSSGFALVLVVILIISGCAKNSANDVESFVMGPDGLIMSFVQNAPQDKYIVGTADESISIAIDIWNKGTHPRNYDSSEDSDVADFRELGRISISGFDKNIIVINKNSEGKVKDYKDFKEKDVYLPPASSLNPRGGLYTAEFNGNIKAGSLIVNKYEPTILVTACYKYSTIASPAVCIDPFPFDTRQKKVCSLGSQNLEQEGAPVAITKIDQEAASGKIRFKISIENVGKGDVIWSSILGPLMDRCSPTGGSVEGVLDRKDFDKVKLDEVKIGGVDLMKIDPATGKSKCTPFAEDTSNVIRLFDGKGFVICTLDTSLMNSQSAFTTPISIKLSYGYRSTISKKISIQKIDD